VLSIDPNDWERFTFEHYLLSCVMQGNTLATLDWEQIHTILDVDCGNGHWCEETGADKTGT
jgi:hypothetical protein